MAGMEVVAQIWEITKFILIWFWWFILLIWIFYLKIRWKKYPIEAVIIEKRGDNLIKTNDRAGRHKDPYTGMNNYRLLKSKDTIPIVNFDAILHNVTVNTTLFERFVNFLRGNTGTIFLFRYGSKQYKPIKIKVNDKFKIVYREIKDNKGELSYIRIYQPFDPRDKLGMLDFEVVDWDNMNEMVQEWKATLERRQKQKEFWKQLAIPAIIIGAATILSIVMIKFGYDYAINMKPAQASEPAQPAKVPIIGDLLPG